MRLRELRTGSLVTAAAAVAALCLYLPQLAPTVGPGDTAELTTATLTLGVPHPTGYPLFILLGNLFSRLLWVGDQAWRLNLLNASIGALAIGATAACVWRLSRSWPAAWFAALIFACVPAFLESCLTNEVYTLHVLLQACLLLAWLGWEEDGGRKGTWHIALLLGLGMTHHLMTVLIAPWVLAAILTRWRSWLRPGGLALSVAVASIPLALYAYLPIASARTPEIDWGHIRSLRSFLLHVTGRSYHSVVQPGMATDSQSLQSLGDALGSHWLLLLPLAIAGLVALRERRKVLLVLGGALATTFVFALSYQVVDQQTFFIPSLQLAAILSGLGAWKLSTALVQRTPSLRAASVAALVLLPLTLAATTMDPGAKANSLSSHDTARALLRAAPAEALLYTHGPSGFVPLYPLAVLGMRPDMELVDSTLMLRGRYPEALERLRGVPIPKGRDPQLITARAAVGTGRPVVLLPGTPDLDWAQAGLVRTRHGAYDLLVEGRAPIPDQTGPTGPRPQLLEASSAPRAARRGEVVPLRLTWSIPTGSIWGEATVMVALGSEQGVLLDDEERPLLAWFTPLAQVDSERERIEETLALLIPRKAPAGRWRWVVALRGPEGWEPVIPPDPALMTIEVEDATIALWEP
jgi:hypothetical protein